MIRRLLLAAAAWALLTALWMLGAVTGWLLGDPFDKWLAKRAKKSRRIPRAAQRRSTISTF